MTTPTALLERAVAGDRAALREVVDGWIGPIRRWALIATGDPVRADDAVQESLVRLLRSIHTYDPTRPFGPWLRTLVTNAARNEVTRRSRPDPEPEPPAEPRGLGHRLDLARACARVRAAFATLPPRQREILDLVDLQGVSPSEAAAQLGLTPGAVRGQLFQARRAVREVVGAEAVLPLLRGA